MKTLVFSDTHLGKYDKNKDRFLTELIKEYDRVIINGDFYDSWLISFNEFVNSQYSNLITLLSSKETVYIFGNHDRKEDLDINILESFTSYYGDKYTLKIGKNTFHFEHGHNLLKDRETFIYKLYYTV